MIRVLGAAAWCCSVLAVVCLVLGVLAAPVGVAKADEPGSGSAGGLNCGGLNYGACNVPQATCIGGADCHTFDGQEPCKCKWQTFRVVVGEDPMDVTGCGCAPKP